MEKEIIAPLLKVSPVTNQVQASASGCCGGAPANNADACCQLDEQKKAEGETGCGCGTSGSAVAASTGCC